MQCTILAARTIDFAASAAVVPPLFPEIFIHSKPLGRCERALPYGASPTARLSHCFAVLFGGHSAPAFALARGPAAAQSLLMRKALTRLSTARCAQKRFPLARERVAV